MDVPDPSYFKNETETTARNKFSRKSHVANNRRSSLYQQVYSLSSRRRAEISDSRPRPTYIENGEAVGDIHADRIGISMSEQKTSRTIPEKVAQLYYTLGLFCSSHPLLIIILASLVVIISCFPLFTLPFLGNKPKEFVTPYENYTVPPTIGLEGDWPRWYRGPPSIYIQQIIIKSAVLPWNSDLILTDAFRGPLSEVFHVTEFLKKFQIDNGSAPFSKLCYSVGEVKSKVLKGKISMLPEFGCLIVSPADFWQQKYEKFREDPEILNTILNFQSHQKGRSGLAEILLGMNVRDTGFKRFPLKVRQRIVSYAVTLVLQSYDSRYIEGLRAALLKLYPTSIYSTLETTPEDSSSVLLNASSKIVEDHKQNNEIDDDLNIIHVYYPSQSSIFELIPLAVTYITMFMYVYFSVKKIEIITSKFGIAVSALATVVASLCMSVGLCTHFGMTFEINSKAIYPFLIIVIGLENVLVLTRSVVSTATNLDVKIRVAQGLSKEGWSITKNLLTEVTILTIGFFTFIPAVQEFCILAIVGLLSDFFLQTFFFATVLSVDIHRRKLNPDSTRDIRYAYPPLRTPIHHSDNISGLQRIKSNSQIKSEHNGTLKKVPSGGSISVVAPSHNTPILVKIPKRLRLIYFWARTRFFQRTFTIFMIGWLSVIIYESGIVARFGHDPEDIVVPLQQQEHAVQNITQVPLSLLHSSDEKYSKPLVLAKGGQSVPNNLTLKIQNHNNKILRELYSHNPYIWRRLTPYHWQVFFGVYNVSLTGRYISILPSICISVPIPPKVAIAQRHPHELQQAKKFNWQAIAIAFDTIDLVDEYDSPTPTGSPVGKIIKKGFISSSEDDPYIPSSPHNVKKNDAMKKASPVELALTMLLAIPSVIFIAYLFVSLYRCFCSRNYAEWRSNLWRSSDSSQDHYTQIVFEALPLVLDGHPQDVECIGSDGNIIASVCLAGVLKVWHVGNGENVVSVDRQKYFEQLVAGADKEENYSNGVPSDGESGGCSPPDHDNAFNKLSSEYTSNAAQGWTIRSRSHISDSQASLERNNSQENAIQNSQFLPQGIPIPKTRMNNSPPLVVGSPNSRQSTSSPINQMRSSTKNLTSTKNNKSSTQSPNFETVDFPSNYSDDRYRIQKNNLEGSVDSALIDDLQSVWCLDCQESFIFLGTGCGRLECWDAYHGVLKCIYEDGNSAGIVCIKVIGNKIISARLNGSLDFLEIEYNNLCGQASSDSPSPYHRWFAGDMDEFSTEFNRMSTYSFEAESEIRVVWITTQKAHQQPISCLECEGGRILTGSQDHTLKVFRLEDHLPLYTLHGHYGPITCLFIDKFSPMNSGSGSHDGMLCVWDLLTGMCMYSIQAHDGPVSSLTYSASYIISVGGDDKICVWERFQGHPLHTIQLDHAYCSSLVMLTHNLLITSKQGSLIVWDVRTGEPVRAVRLGHRDNAVFVRQIIGCADAVLCDYGSQLRLVRFPSVVNKYD